MRTFGRIGILAFVLLVCVSASFAKPYSYVEVLAGLGFPMQIEGYKAGTGVNPGAVGTTIVINSLFPLGGTFSLSPSFGFLSTNGEIPGPQFPLDATFQQSELALDMLIKLRHQNRLRVGPGVSGAWWIAAEDLDRRPTDYEYDPDRRVLRSQSFMVRGVAHMMLRNPAVSGVSMKLVGAYPLADVFQIENTAATGYISLQVGFSMPLN